MTPIDRFRAYLRIRTDHPSPDYLACEAFLKQQATDLNLPFQSIQCVPNKPIIIISVPGSDPSLPSIMLNSHTDVVPVPDESKWSSPPFDALINEKGDIIARGSQDMKCVGMWYLEAVRNLRANNIVLKRTLHLVYVPDEEIGGHDGMVLFLETDVFKNLNVGFALDEGLANPDDAFKVYYGERAPWWFKVIARGNVGHGSQFIQNTAASKLNKAINKILAFRDAEEERLKNGVKEDGKTPLTLGDVTSVNWTMMSGGVQFNVVPERMEAGFDMRVSPSVDLKRFKQTLERWVSECGCELEWVQYFPSNTTTSLDPTTNPFWKAILSSSSIKLTPEIFPAATDSRYVRAKNVPALGISPIRKTPVLLHDHNEYLNTSTYMDGIEWYVGVLGALGNVV